LNAALLLTHWSRPRFGEQSIYAAKFAFFENPLNNRTSLNTRRELDHETTRTNGMMLVEHSTKHQDFVIRHESFKTKNFHPECTLHRHEALAQKASPA
jgi:hypothetical protein